MKRFAGVIAGIVLGLSASVLANDYFNASGVPSTGGALNSATMRGEFSSIGSGFDKLPTLTGNGNKVVTVNAGATALTATAATALTGMVIGTNLQAWDAELDALASVTSAANKLPYFTGAGTATVTDLSAFARTFLDDADGAAVMVTLGAAPLASPTFTGTPAAPTAAAGTSTTQIATTAFVQGAMPTGTMVDYVGASAPTGWVLASGRTLGDATSGGTERANADTATLFALLWNSMSDTEAPVSTGRGANAAADYAAHKTITLPDLRGRAAYGKDNMGGTTASRVTAAVSGVTGTTLGTAGGDERQHGHTHGYSGTTTGQSVDHTHTIVGTDLTVGGSTLAEVRGATANNINSTTSGVSADHSHNYSGTTVSTGAGSSQNLAPAYIVTKILKL